MISKEELLRYAAYARKHKHRKHNMAITFTYRQEARDKSLANAKVIAKCWKHFLRCTKIHIRRGYIVTATIENFQELRRFHPFAVAVNRQVKLLREGNFSVDTKQKKH